MLKEKNKMLEVVQWFPTVFSIKSKLVNDRKALLIWLLSSISVPPPSLPPMSNSFSPVSSQCSGHIVSFTSWSMPCLLLHQDLEYGIISQRPLFQFSLVKPISVHSSELFLDVTFSGMSVDFSGISANHYQSTKL